jgi:hypothetical protein
MKRCPTNYDRGRRSASGGKNGRLRSPISSRTNRPPAIFVRVEGKYTWSTKYASAHLRNRKGYVYLTWRDGDKVRSFYLGKAPRKSPTPALEGETSTSAELVPAADVVRRGKLRGSR